MREEKYKNLGRLLKPSQIAFIGGSDAEVAINEAKRRGFLGSIWAVNPKRDFIAGYKCYKSVLDLPFGPDAVFLAIPASKIIKTIKDLNSINTGGIVCYSAGFKEIGNKGLSLEHQLINSLENMVLVGPNCYGIINYLDNTALWPFAHGGYCPGFGAAIITQSGMLSSDITMNQRSLPITHMISLGNQASLTNTDFINYLIDKKEVRAFGLHIECIENIKEFELAVHKAFEIQKPIVVLKTGKSEIGAALTKSHTGSIAGSDKIYDSFFKKLGIITVNTPSELIETLKFACISGIPEGMKCSAFTCSGGGAAMVADIGESLGIEFPKFSKKNLKSISSFLPDIATVSNPLDYTTPIWGQKKITKPLFQKAINALKSDFSILIQDYPLSGLDETKIYYLNDAMGFSEAVKKIKIPGAIISTISENIDKKTREELISKGITPLQGIGESLVAIKNIVKWYLVQKNKKNKKDKLIPINKYFFNLKNITYLSELESKNILNSKNLSIPMSVRCSSKDILKKGKELGFPLVLKLICKNLIHKTDYGAVETNIKDEKQLNNALHVMKSSLAKNFPKFLTDDFLLERMEKKPICELVIGIKRDNFFGIIITIGSGGIFVDLLDDFKVIVCPSSREEIKDQLLSLKIGKLIMGYRGLEKINIDNIIDFIETLIFLINKKDLKIAEIEINPLFLYKNHVKAIDCVIAVGS